MAVLLAVSAVALHSAEVGWAAMARYAAYLLLAVVVPGVLVLRLATPRLCRSLEEEVVFGAMAGFMVQLPVYLIGVAVGLPLLPAALPVALLAGCMASRRRRELLIPAVTPAPARLVWPLTAIAAYLLVWTARYCFASVPIPDRAPMSPYVDLPFHLAIVADLRHHFPPETSWVAGEPLYYHWFVHAQLAATSWLTGLDPALLLTRLWLPAALVLVTLGTGFVAARAARSSWAGVIGGLVLVPLSNFDLLRWPDEPNTPLLNAGLILSPTQTYGTALLPLVLLLLFGVLEARPRVPAALWAGLAAAVIGLSGAKATFMPMLFAGSLSALVVGSLLARRLDRRLLGVTAVSLVALVFAQVVLFGGVSQGLRFEPFHFTTWQATRILRLPADPDLSTAGGVLSAVVTLAAWGVPAVGAVGLLFDRRWTDPRAVFMAGLVAAGWGAALLLGQPGMSEVYFARSTAVPVAILSGWGCASLLRGADRRWRSRYATAAAAGAVIAFLATRLTPLKAPDPGQQQLLAQLATPYLLVLAALAILGAALWYCVRRRGWPRRSAAAVAVFLVLGMPAAMALDPQPSLLQSWPEPEQEQPRIAAGGVRAAHWLRAHSGPDDLVATNAHTLLPHSADVRAFWMAAYSERRFLVEGWGYTPRVNEALTRLDEGASHAVPFWDAALLALNDAAFGAPTPESVAALESLGVDWLLADTRFPVRPDLLSRHADLVFSAGAYRVWRIRP